MNRKKAISLMLAVLLLAGTVTGFAAAGSKDDPLISLEWLYGTFAKQLKDKAGAETSKIYGQYLGTGAFMTVRAGETQRLDTGMAAVFVSGKATLELYKGTVVDVTDGTEMKDGAAFKANHRYLAAEDTEAAIYADTDCTVSVEGAKNSTEVKVPVNVNFTDVKTSDWFYNDVYSAVSMGLINGMSETSYEPNGTLTGGQTVKLAACLHQLYNNGEITLSGTGANWVEPYVLYAIAAGIFNGFDDYNTPISRRDFVSVFYNAMPERTYEEINTVSDGAIPDVKMSDEAAERIYAFYRAGILTGDETGKFNAGSTIKRSEAAAILTRMYDSSARKSVTLP